MNTATLQQAFKAAHELLMNACADEVLLMLRNATSDFDTVGPLKAKVAELRMQDVVAGSTARAGDLSVILLASSIPPGQRRLEAKDRVLWRGREYAVIQYDDATDSIGAQVLAVKILVRG